jgi:hypothetical protein
MRTFVAPWRIMTEVSLRKQLKFGGNEGEVWKVAISVDASHLLWEQRVACSNHAAPTS